MINQVTETVEKPLFQVGLAAANAVAATLLFKHSEGKKPFPGLVAGFLLLFSTYHIYMAVKLSREKEL